jgi:hypothetical protein
MELPLHGLYSTFLLSNQDLRKCEYISRPLPKNTSYLHNSSDLPIRVERVKKLNNNFLRFTNFRIKQESDSSCDEEEDVDKYKRLMGNFKTTTDNAENRFNPSLVDKNEKKTINMNFFNEKMLTLKKKFYEKELKYNLKEMKREKACLVQRYLETEAVNYDFMRRKKSSVIDIRTLRSQPSNLTFYESKFLEFQQDQEVLNKKLQKMFGNKIPERLQLNTPMYYQPYIDNIKEKFIDQESPAHKKKRKSKMSLNVMDLAGKIGYYNLFKII